MTNNKAPVELYRKYRPSLFKEVVGQPGAVKTLKGMLESSKFPHTLLLTGPSGCGKTTLARILQKKLKCGDSDFVEINAAESRGIDSVREVQQRMGLTPLGGESRIWLWDECFPAGSQVASPLGGTVSIETIKIGDMVRGIQGTTKVVDTFQNQVALDRVVKLHFDDGSSLVTTKQHEFLTNQGWMQAEHLAGFEVDLFRILSYTMGNSNRRTSNEDVRSVQERIPRKTISPDSVQQGVFLPVQVHQIRSQLVGQGKATTQNPDLCMVQKGVSFQIQGQGPTGMLLKVLLCKSEQSTQRVRSVRNSDLPGMWGRISDTTVKPHKALQHIMCVQGKESEARIPGQIVFPREQSKSIRWTEKVLPNPRGATSSSTKFRADEEGESRKGRGDSSQGPGNQRTEGYTSCLEGRTRGEWKIDRASDDSDAIAGPDMDPRTADQNRSEFQDQNWISDQLQGGCGKTQIQDRYRSRWERPSIEKDYIARRQKDPETRIVRVDRVEVYQRGDNDESFMGVISDRDRDRGFVVFYDLQIEGHPSYYVDGLLVHNCQKLTQDAQSALLKTLEDTPSHVYFILCTTDPDKLLKTIVTRCTEVKVRALTTAELEAMLQSVVTKESITVNKAVLEAIAEASDGSARKALVILHQVMALSEAEQLEQIHKENSKQNTQDLVKAMLDPKKKWDDIAKLIEMVEQGNEDYESIRRRILGYAKAFMKIPAKMPWAKLILSEFDKNWYDCGWAGLWLRAAYVFGDRK